MNSLARFYLPQADWGESVLVLKGEEAHHCVRVLRLKAGTRIEVFDGVGQSATGTLSSVSKDHVEVQIESKQYTPPPSLRISLYQAIPKGGNMEWIVQKAVELGVLEIQPLISTHTVVKPDQLEKKAQKWQKIALEACKQCGQNWLPRVQTPMNYDQWLTQYELEGCALIAALDPRAVSLAEGIAQFQRTGAAAVLIGPEGDFSQKEYDLAIGQGFQPVSLGEIVMRVETATLYTLSALKYALGT